MAYELEELSLELIEELVPLTPRIKRGDALRQSISWRHVREAEAKAALALARRLVAILWRITRG